jgi:hypothetical protein
MPVSAPATEQAKIMTDPYNFPQTDEPISGGPNRDQRSDPGIGGLWGQAAVSDAPVKLIRIANGIHGCST